MFWGILLLKIYFYGSRNIIDIADILYKSGA